MSFANYDVLERLKNTTGASSYTAMAQDLGFNKNAPAKWKISENPPLEACYRCSKKYDVSIDFLLFGKHNAKSIKMDADEFFAAYVKMLQVGTISKIIKVGEGYDEESVVKLADLLYKELFGQESFKEMIEALRQDNS